MELYKDESRSFEERAADLVSRMTLEEKVNEVGNHGAAIPRLGLPYYNYWSEASHGFFGPFKFRPMDVTSYPVCLAMSQSWDTDKIKKVTTAISDECRAYHNLDGDELHFWCPTINMARDPRNGRSDENFGEDPYLAGKMAAAYIQGMQGDDDKYIKTVATPKHYALNSSENNRHKGSSNVDEATLREYYTKAFEYAVREGGAQSIMTSYNRVNGVPSSCNDLLLTTLLREEWGFDGFVVSDCGAVADCYTSPMFIGGDGQNRPGHCYAKSLEEASAMSLTAGTDMSCGSEHKYNLLKAVEDGLISEDTIDRALIRILTSRFRLGLFDEKTPYSGIGRESICSEAMQDLSVDMANDTIVLLKNDKKLLPLDKHQMKSVLVVGPNAIYRELGGYSAGSMSKIVETVVNVMALQGIKNELADTDVKVIYEKGWCSGKETGKSMLDQQLEKDVEQAIDSEKETKTYAMDLLPGIDQTQAASMMADFMGPNATPESVAASFGAAAKYVPDDPDRGGDNDVLFARALEAAKTVDYVIVVAGTDASNASEEHDRDTLALPYGQDEKIQKLIQANDHTIVVLTTLGAVSGAFFKKAHTVINAHFAGQAQGTAIANVLFGKVNPNAKLTATWYASENDLPLINDYGLRWNDTCDTKTRTYMYFDRKPMFPFGYGLSYTAFEYSQFKINKDSFDANETIHVTVDVTNTGSRDGAEIVELYVSKVIPQGTYDNKPLRQLKAFDKVFLKAGETKTVDLKVKVSDISFWSYLHKKMTVEKGSYRVEIGRSSADIVCSGTVFIDGQWQAGLSNVYAVSDKYIFNVGEQAAVKASATLEDTTHLCMQAYKPVYESSDETVLTVDPDGHITAKGSGCARINVKVTYKNQTKSCSLAMAVK
ncbi:MAG: glycoside hydrolase family 3 C-terminal domain-containing protein [Catenibacillus sp.]